MISLMLLFPIFACCILFLTKKSVLNNSLIVIYAILHLICSIYLCCDFNPIDIKQSFFAVTGINKIFLILLSIIFCAVAVYNSAYMKGNDFSVRKLRHYSYAVLMFVLSITGAILSTNLGVNWIFIEATTLTSAYLIYFEKTKHSIEAAWKYVFICSIGIALAFVGIILLTASTGNLNSLYYQDLYNQAQNFDLFWLKLSFVFVLFGLGTKMGLAPVHFWLPDAHAQAPSPISALLSAALLNSSFLMIINVFKVIVSAGCDFYPRILLFVMGFLSLFVAAVFIYHINNYKRMLAYSSVENMGILAICTALGGLGMIAALIHLVGHSLAKASFFLTSGNILKIYNTKKIKSVKGLLTVDKKTGWLWIFSFLSIAAFPPSVLFISEFYIVKDMLQKGHYALMLLFLFLLTVILYGLGKAVFNMSAKNDAENRKVHLSLLMYIPQIILLIISFFAGIFLPFSNVFTAAVEGF